MEKIIRTTYEIVTEESAAEGDAEERGWEDEDGELFEDDEEQTAVDKAVTWLIDHGAGFHPSCSCFTPGIWYSSEPQHDMHDGSYRSESFHLDGFTEQEQAEIYYRVTEYTPISPHAELALTIMEWHGGQWSALYKVGSSWFAGHNVKEHHARDALRELRRIRKPEADFIADKLNAYVEWEHRRFIQGIYTGEIRHYD